MTDQMTTMPGRRALVIGIVCCGTGVALGAFGAHGLKGSLATSHDAETAARLLENWQTGVQYQIWHGLALLAIGLWQVARRESSLTGEIAAGAFVAGLLAFSGGLYVRVLADAPAVAAIVPVGGVLLLAGWVCFGLMAWRVRERPQ